MAARQLANLEYAFAQWTEASGLTFQFAGSMDLIGERDLLRRDPR